MKYPHDRPRRPARVAEPVQVYLEAAERDRLDRLTERLGTTKSDVLRRGLEALEAQTGAPGRPLGELAEFPTFKGDGLLPGVNLADNGSLLDLMDGEGSGAAC